MDSEAQNWKEESPVIKIRRCEQEIHAILNKWQYITEDRFLNDVLSGKLPDAEEDALIVQCLLDKREAFLKDTEEIQKQIDYA